MRTAANFFLHLRRARAELFQSGILFFIQSLSTTLLTLPLMVIIDSLLMPTTAPNERDSYLWTILLKVLPPVSAEQLVLGAAIALLSLTALSAILEFFERLSTADAADHVVESLREDLIGRLMTRRQGYLDRKRKSDLVTRLSHDAASLETLITSGLATVTRSLPTLVLLFAILFLIQAKMAFLVLATLPVSYFLSLYFARSARANLAKLRSETQHFESEALHLLAAAPVVKSLTLEDLAMRSLHSRLSEISRHVLNLRRSDGALIASMTGVRNILRAVLILLGGALVLRRQMTPGELTVFLVAIGPLSRSVVAISQFISDFGRASISLDRIEALFRDLENEGETQGTQAFVSLPFPDATTLRFENVSFAYPNMPFMLQNFSTSFHAGELIALMGASGSGRTTFGRLINRLLDPLEGRIAIGRTDLRRFRLEVLRTYVTVVDQEPFFIPGTVRENLLLGAETSEVREQQISEVLHATNAYDFVQTLPEKLETVIGEGGYDLSASQQRRLSLARALLRNQSQIFVLDEPTAGLDPDSAASVIGSIHRLAERGVMVFWITNRLEEIPLADRVVVFSRNQNPLIGTHDDLMARDTMYRSYFMPLESQRGPRQKKPRPESELER